MAYLSLTNDELALLRFTCDLHFVEESPLWPLEANPHEPASYDDAYHALTTRNVIDPHTFRLTDDALNRIAPVTECDGRVVHIAHGADEVVQSDYYLLDEIAVRFLPAPTDDSGEPTGAHLFGDDFDDAELIEHFARRVMPRRAAGDLSDVTLRAIEMLALSLVAAPFRVSATDRVSAADDGAGQTEISLGLVRELLGTPPSDASEKPSHTIETAFIPRRRLAPPGARQVSPRVDAIEASVGHPVWDDAIAGLCTKGVLQIEAGRLRLRPAFADLVRAIGDSPRHTFVRYDFGDDEWLVRECTLLPVDGSLFELTQTPSGQSRIRELNGEVLREALMSAVGALPRPDLDLDDETRTFVRAELPLRPR